MTQILAKRPTDCYSCRIVSATGLIGAGSYIGYHGWKKKGLGGMTMVGLALATVGLGTARLMNYPYFGKSPSASQEQ